MNDNKIIFFLLGEKAYLVIQSVIEFNSDIVDCVYVGRDDGVENDFSLEIKKICLQNNIIFFDRHPELSYKFNDDYYMLAIGWKWMLPVYPKLIVIHDSLLPNYRGFAPLVNCLINGEDKIGATALFGALEYDRGEIIGQAHEYISYPLKIRAAIAIMAKLYIDLVEKIVEKVRLNDVILSIKQNEADATYSAWRDDKDYWIDWDASSAEIARFIDAVGNPYSGARSFLNGEMVIIDSASLVEDVMVMDRKNAIGKVLFVKDGFPVVVCKKGMLKITEMKSDNRTVLVTGAGGSIGSELCRQILKTTPKRLLLVEMSEFALYQIHQELQAGLATGQKRQGDHFEIVPLLGSVCDDERMHEIMDTWKPNTVYHAAAYKHVPLVEHNPSEGVRNNIWGTRVCAEAAARNGVQNFVLVSTDKAVRPTNIMGATKRMAEMVLQALAELNPRTCFSMVRFGNVLGSSGSVVPLFREQIKSGGPITLTHADITRYFMTIPEAAQLVIQAGAMGSGGDVFVLDMGQPVRIYDLASRIVELSGLTLKNHDNPEGDIEIIVTGLRPGEKLYEELLIGDNPKPTQHARIMKAHEPFLPWDQLQGKLNALEMAMLANDVPMLRGFLQQLVPGYQPSGDVVDWVHLAQEREAAENL